MLREELLAARPKIKRRALHYLLEELERRRGWPVIAGGGGDVLVVDLDDLRALVDDAVDLNAGNAGTPARYRLD